jgi:hypothetical protein
VSEEMTSTIIGIDPGRKGAICVRRGGEVVEIVRLAKWREHGDALADVISRHPDPSLVLLEEVTLGSKLITSYVSIRERARALGLPLRTVRPVAWQRAVGAGPSKRDGYRDAAGGRARKRFLQDHCEAVTGTRYVAEECDAVLIAVAGERTLDTQPRKA